MTLSKEEILDSVVGSAYFTTNEGATTLILKIDAITAMQQYSEAQLKAERERAGKLMEALQWLLTVKKYKDENGKNEFYEIERLGAWDNALTAINEYNNKPPSANQQ